MAQQLTVSTPYPLPRRRGLSTHLLSVQFILLLGYLAFVPFGPYPIPVLGTKLDVILGLGLLIALLPELPMAVSRQPRVVTFTLLVYLATTFLSVAASDAPVTSLRQWLVTLGYATVAYIGSTVFAPHLRKVQFWFMLFAVMTSLTVFFLVSTIHSDERFAFGPTFGVPMPEGLRYIDPNHTGVGLMLALVVGIRALRRPKSYQAVLKWGLTALSLCAIGAAALITQSRTAIIAFSAGISLSLASLVAIGIIRPKLRHYAIHSVTTLFACVAVAVLVSPFVWSYGAMVLDRLVNAGNDTARVSLYIEAFAQYGESLKTFILGKGYMTGNPHNEYLRTLAGSGILSLSAFILFLSAVICTSTLPPSGIYTEDMAKFAVAFFIVAAITFYPLVKTFWVSIFFVLAFGLNTRRRANHLQADSAF